MNTLYSSPVMVSYTPLEVITTVHWDCDALSKIALISLRPSLSPI